MSIDRASGDPMRFAVLAILAEGAAHGYAVHRVLETRFGDLLEPNYGRVYQLLAGLERSGWVACSERRTGRRPPRRVYELSGRGADALAAWLAAPAARGAVLAPEMLVRLLVARSRGLDVGERIDAEIARARDALACAGGEVAASGSTGEGDPVVRLFALSRRLRAMADLRALEEGRDWFTPRRAAPAGAARVRATASRRAPAG